MKRITAITKCNGVLAEIVDRKAKRIKRAVEQMADAADDKASELEEKAEDIINGLGAVAGSEQTPELQARLNAYNGAISEAQECRQAASNFRALLTKLDEEIPAEKEEA